MNFLNMFKIFIAANLNRKHTLKLTDKNYLKSYSHETFKIHFKVFSFF